MRSGISGSKKGQMTMVNLIMLIIVFVVYGVFGLPILNPMITDLVASLMGGPQTAATPILITLIDLFPVALLLMIFITGFHQTVPRTG
jgi:hypothetical protein